MLLKDHKSQIGPYVLFQKSSRIKNLVSRAFSGNLVTGDLHHWLYKTMVIPHFYYGDILYDAMSKHDANRLEVLQNRCLRICLTCEPRTKVKDILAEAHTFPSRERRTHHTCGIVHKGLTNMSTPGVNNMFAYCHETAVREKRVQRNYSVKMPNCRLEISRKNVRYRALSIITTFLPMSNQPQVMNASKAE